jgi:prepilin-type processing-associated H-X9-DG protein
MAVGTKETPVDVREGRMSCRTCSIIGCLGMILVAVVVAPVFLNAGKPSRQSRCLMNLKQVSFAHVMYAREHEDVLPSAARWPEKLYPYTGTPAVHTCPSDDRSSGPMWSDTLISYTMHGAVGGMDSETMVEPDEVLLTWDGLVPVGGIDDVIFRHNGGANSGYVDGHAKWVRETAWADEWREPEVEDAAERGVTESGVDENR